MIVLDAAALVDVVLDQPPKAWVLDQITGREVRAPAHQPAEVLSALARVWRSGEISDEVAGEALREASALEQDLSLPSAEHLARAFELQGRIRVLDGLYVALAEEHRCPLVTTDRRLVAAQPPCELRSPAGG